MPPPRGPDIHPDCRQLSPRLSRYIGLSTPLIGLIVTRIREIKQHFARIAALIRNGDYAPRRFAPRRPQAEPKPRPPSQLPRKFGWLLKLVPQAVGSRSQLQNLLRDPEMVALIAAAPASSAM